MQRGSCVRGLPGYPAPPCSPQVSLMHKAQAVFELTTYPSLT
ncbi:hypothetical protein [Acetobacter lambici]|nr:hypothetical protein [Acetobacter lambici]